MSVKLDCQWTVFSGRSRIFQQTFTNLRIWPADNFPDSPVFFRKYRKNFWIFFAKFRWFLEELKYLKLNTSLNSHSISPKNQLLPGVTKIQNQYFNIKNLSIVRALLECLFNILFPSSFFFRSQLQLNRFADSENN